MTRNRAYTFCETVKPFGLFILLLMLSASCSNISVETKGNYDLAELPDGSVVYINENSSIQYDKNFSPRTVNLDGEAFFSVVPGETPFVVTCEHGKITVAGTEFDARSTSDELVVEVEKGKVEVEANGQEVKKLKRGDRAVYTSAQRAVQLEKAEYEFRQWLKLLEKEFKKLGKEVKRSSKEIGKESKKAAKELKKDLKKLKND